MIRHFDELQTMNAPHKGGKGSIQAALLLNEDEFEGKGRVFNHCVLKPGLLSGVPPPPDVNDFEVYYILKGKGV